MSNQGPISGDNQLKKIVAHAKEYGFIFPSSEIYDGLGATYDYGQNGAQLKSNIRNYWWKAMVQLHENIVGIDAAIFMHPTTWKASGHVDAFNDPLIDNKDSKKRYRADVLIEDYVAKVQGKITKEAEKAAKRFGDSFDRSKFLETNPRVVQYQEKIDQTNHRFKQAIETNQLNDLKELIEELGIACPESGSRNWTEVRQFNLMFSTELGSVSDETSTIYLRPETAQGIFVNFLNVQKTGRLKIPFGIAQVGKAFRNEIVARQFIFRMREFEQMEMQFFVRPGEELKWYEFWKEKRMKWHHNLGISAEKFRFYDHLNLAHYANAAADIQFDFPMGFKELEGIHSRTDFDLTAHEKHSGKKLQFYDTQTEESFVPYVVETSIGLDRMVLAVLSNGLVEETLEDGSQRILMRIAPQLAPYQVAILPLLNKDGLPEQARKIMDQLKLDYSCYYEEKDTIGRRYRRQDAIGTPYCVTIDHQTLEDQMVTLRDRDSMKQDRINIDKIHSIIDQKVSLRSLLQNL